jgi:hypothetical protein
LTEGASGPAQTYAPGLTKPPRRLRKRRLRPGRDKEPYYVRPWHSAFFWVSLALAVPWLILVCLHSVWSSAGTTLIIYGIIIALAGAIGVHVAAIEDGVHFIAFSSRNAMIGLCLVSIQIFIIPVFSILYLVMNLERGWKPLLLEVMGAAMIWTGYAL